MTLPNALVRDVLTDSDVLSRVDAAFSGKPLADALMMVVQLLRKDSDHYDWVGIYLVERDRLVLAAFAGEVETEHVAIPIGQGICGLAAKEGETVVVPDVSKDPRYLMCFPSTRSEIVVPIKAGSKVLGEIDIDSDQLSAFTEQDQKFLEQAAIILAEHLDGQLGVP
jgi:L-methionine (R)-S-oxide reductase